MGNTLVRVPDITVYPGTSGVPPGPPRCVTTITGYRTVQQYESVTENTPVDGQWVQNDNPIDVADFGKFVFVPTIPPWSLREDVPVVTVTSSSQQRLVTRRVPVYKTSCTPGTPGTPGTPTRIDRGVGPDWLSSAKSLQYVRRNARFSFLLRGNTAAGLTASMSVAGVALAQVVYGLAAIDGELFVVRFGRVAESLGTAEYDDYEVEVREGRGKLVGYSAGSGTDLDQSNLSVGEVVFAAGLVHTEGSAVDSPILEGLTTITAAATGAYSLMGTATTITTTTTPVAGNLPLAGVVSVSVNGVKISSPMGRLPLLGAVGEAVVRSFSGTGGIQASGALRLVGSVEPGAASGATLRVPALSFYAGNLTGAYGQLSLPPYQVLGGSTGGAPVAKFGIAELTLPGVFAGGSGLSGAIGGAEDAQYPPMQLVGSDYPYSYGTPSVTSLVLLSSGGVLASPMNVGASNLEFLSVADYFNPMAAILVDFTSGLGVSGDVSITIALDATMESALSLSDTMTLAQILEAVISDGLTLSDGQAPDAGAYKQYVYNILSGAATRFDGFDFKGFTHFNGETYAYNSTGVHRVVDAPADPIAAMVDLGVSTFGVSSMKHVETAYIGLATDGEVFLKLVADGRDKTYRVVQRFPTMRAHTGRGVVGREWGVQLQLLDATTADLDDIEFVLATSGRRWTR